ncbi:MAG: valine--tRNA ligase [Pseudomonadota bacterium]|nr:valine--tRNA ligase [Pseudomonadota bacterium]
MEHHYHPKKIETYWSNWWTEHKLGKPTGDGPPYCIMMPPPNVTGSLHMGHGFQISLMDGLIRYHRMLGHHTLWQVGTDHAGIATQMVVERKLEKQGTKRQQLGRHGFLAKVWDWKAESGGTITDQMRRMGASVDWDRERFTMDDDFSSSVVDAFVRLYQDGLIYKGKKLVNWDPKLQTAISDLEIINEERNGNLWHIQYPIYDSDQTLTVATTRPETLFGDVAVAVHPDDKRYQHLIGKYLSLPLTERRIPIITDDSVDPDFGSGCVKITPAHDFNDHAMGIKHQLDSINIFNPDASLNHNVPKAYQNLDRQDARVSVIKELKVLNLLTKIEPYRHTVPVGDRSGVVIEPYLTEQWFVRCEQLAERALSVVKDGTISFFPHNYVNTYYRWLEDIQDWCISRQLWWGHRIPAWYDDQGNHYVATSEAAARSHYQIPSHIVLNQDEDVLDTWFSSAIWPIGTLGWPHQTQALDTFFPTQVLMTGHDIIFFWVARMIMMSLYLTDDVPFKHVYITGLIRDENNDKMSKSKGNIIDPLDLVDGIDLESLLHKRTHGLMQPEKAAYIAKQTKKQFPNGIKPHGVDALRFTYFALASTGRDIRFDMNRLSGYRNFCNKLWNAARFVMAQLTEKPLECSWQQKGIHDQWILSRLETVKTDSHRYYENYRFDHLAQLLYDFVWHDFCDWYIELCKPILLKQNSESLSSLHTLYNVLEQVLRLLHPLMPYITETLWQSCRPYLNNPPESIMQTAYPVSHPLNQDQGAVSSIQRLKAIITAIRTMRSEMQISPATTVGLYFSGGSDEDTNHLNSMLSWIQVLAKTHLPVWKNIDNIPPSAQQRVGNMGIHIPLEGLIEPEQETLRVEKQVAKLAKQLKVLNTRLDNPDYRKHVAAEVLDANRKQRHAWNQMIENYQNHLVELARLQDQTNPEQ